MGGTMGIGYGGFAYGPRANYRHLLAHRVAYRIQFGPIPASMTVSHLCHNRRCVKGEHLTVEPIKANLGRSVVGEGHRDAQLKEWEVLEIRQIWDDGEATVTQLATKYGVNSGTVSLIVRRRTWRYLDERGMPSLRS